MTEFREGTLPRLLNLWRMAPPVIRGILMMCIASVFFSAMHVTVRFVARDVPPMQIAFLRSVFGFVIFLPLLLSSGWPSCAPNGCGCMRYAGCSMPRR